ncbi:MAG: hypothetical protein HS111_32190 [Kofleriaceae bacterium]|nr:hypothetical protein [Kofleriaceae bacterium]
MPLDHAAQALGELAGAATAQQREQPVAHPRLGVLGTGGVERVGGAPQVLDDVDDIEDDRDLGAELARGTLHSLDLIALPVDEHDPAATVFGISARRLGERIVDDLLRAVLDARPHPLLRRSRADRVEVVGPARVRDVGRGAHPRRQRVHGRDLRHALAIPLLARRQPRLEPARRRLGGALRRRTQVGVAHRDALTVELRIIRSLVASGSRSTFS